MRIISITSGKGGVGKTSVSANLGIELAARGARTAVLDCDFGLANLALSMGLEPRHTLKNVVDGRPLERAFTPGPEGLRVLAGCSGEQALVNLDYESLADLAVGFDALPLAYDFLLLDNAAGISSGVLSINAAADETLLVITPDPSSMMDGYATIKLLLEMKPRARIQCVVNQARHEQHGQAVHERFAGVVQSFLKVRVEHAGTIRRDEAVVRAARRRTPVAVAHRRSGAARDFGRLAARLSGIEPEPEQGRGFIARLLGFRPAVA